MHRLLLIIKTIGISVQIINSDCKTSDFGSIVHLSVTFFIYLLVLLTFLCYRLPSAKSYRRKMMVIMLSSGALMCLLLWWVQLELHTSDCQFSFHKLSTFLHVSGEIANISLLKAFKNLLIVFAFLEKIFCSM